MYEVVAQKLAAGETVILDGGTGTEIQRLGVPMHDETWCAQINITRPGDVQAVHESYVRAGADVIIANTFATSPFLYHALKRDGDIAHIDQAAIHIAREAIRNSAEKSIALAGSFSIARPTRKRGAKTTRQRSWTPAKMMPLLRQKANTLAETGCDLIIMEMLCDVEHSLWATEAAVETGLPVWAGISVERRADGRLAGYGNGEWSLEEIVPVVMAAGAKACLVMHNEISATADALEIIKACWAGPIGAYPENRTFKARPSTFGDTTPDDFAEYSRRWRRSGASIIGGCCGIGPDHIARLAQTVAGT